MRIFACALILIGLGVSFTGCGYSGNPAVHTSPPAAPMITTQPMSQSVPAGQTAMFSVGATGTQPFAYQWYMGAQAVGTNASSYTTPSTTSADNGVQIKVTVSNAAGSQTSAPATLTVTPVSTVPGVKLSVMSLTFANQTVGATSTAQLVMLMNIGTASLTISGIAASGDFAESNNCGASVPVASNCTISVTFKPTATGTRPGTLTISDNAAGSPQSVLLSGTGVAASTSAVNVLTLHNDNARTGQNLSETILTTTDVNSANFGELGLLSVDGLVDAEALFVSNLIVAGSAHNVVFVVTEHDSLYAFDADTFSQLWTVSLLGPNETTSDNRGCGQVSPEIGITSTPVIDLTAGTHGTIFAVAMSKDNSGDYHQRLHALDITTGAELTGGPVTIQASFPGTGANSSNGNVVFDPAQYKERAGLLLMNHEIYTSWASHCDDQPYTGWLISYSESTLQQSSVLNVTPNGSEGAIWMAGAGLAADTLGNIYFLDANGTFDDTLDSSGFPVHGDFGNAFLKVSTSSNNLAVADYFTMFNTDAESNADEDLGSGGALVMPDLMDGSGNTWHLAVGAGKDAHIYVVNRDLMGKFNTNNDTAIYQEIDGGLSGGVFSMPVYFNNTVYFGAVGDSLKAFSIVNAKLGASATSKSAASFGYPGTSPSISANGTTNGIVWAVENGSTGVLHAYDATNLANELYNSNQAANNRDQFSDNKFVTPMIANGKVYVGTPNSVVVFGLLQ
jgi:Abnormal spindle-like microcephaly-assoc'd, ASPM-SPD-2-Hydin